MAGWVLSLGRPPSGNAMPAFNLHLSGQVRATGPASTWQRAPASAYATARRPAEKWLNFGSKNEPRPRALLFTASLLYSAVAATIITPAPPKPFITSNDFVFSTRHCCCCCLCSSFRYARERERDTLCVSWRYTRCKKLLCTHAESSPNEKEELRGDHIYSSLTAAERQTFDFLQGIFNCWEWEPLCAFVCNNCWFVWSSATQLCTHFFLVLHLLLCELFSNH